MAALRPCGHWAFTWNARKRLFDFDSTSFHFLNPFQSAIQQRGEVALRDLSGDRRRTARVSVTCTRARYGVLLGI